MGAATERGGREKEMDDSFAMTGGDGPFSYAKNSEGQRKDADSAKGMLLAAIREELDVEYDPSNGPFCIADLGCSTGPNTFIAVETIIEAVSEKYKIKGFQNYVPEFQVYFNDRVSNDFNILFSSLPPNRKYFAAGVPGSFYGRLFPKASLNFVYSAFSVHWLSTVPRELGELNSPACNKGRIHYGNAPKGVGEAYRGQFAKDMESFLAARAEEVIPGGLMELLISGRPGGTLPSQVSIGPLVQPLESCLLDMADEGILNMDKIDSFNFPTYNPSIEELRSLVEKNGSFAIARLEVLPQPSIVPFLSAKECRGGLESIIRKHFGSDIIEELFERYAIKIADKPFISIRDHGIASVLFVVLQRNEY